LIHKVNRPAYLKLVESPKKTNTDPGSGSGGGNAYEQSGNAPSQSPQKPDHSSGEDLTIAQKSADVLAAEQIGMTEVVKDFLEQKKTETHARPGLSIKYTLDAQPAKGLLLNKKVE
jgi:hypothetical protein